MPLFDENFGRHRHKYLLQTGLATLALFAILLVEISVSQGAVIVTVAASTFIVFVVPNSVAAEPRLVVGGHLFGVLAGAVFVGLAAVPGLSGAVDDSRLVWALIASASVGLGILAMVVTDTEHPPAAATCLALALGGWSWSSVVFILAAAAILSVIRIVLRNRLINLI